MLDEPVVVKMPVPSKVPPAADKLPTLTASPLNNTPPVVMLKALMVCVLPVLRFKRAARLTEPAVKTPTPTPDPTVMGPPVTPTKPAPSNEAPALRKRLELNVSPAPEATV
jgi:hypothetical protein